MDSVLGGLGLRERLENTSGADESRLRKRIPFDYRNTAGDLITWNISILIYIYCRFRGAMVARLTPDQKAACSNHVGIN